MVIFGCIAQTLGPANLSQETSSSKKQGMAGQLALGRARTELLLRFHKEENKGGNVRTSQRVLVILKLFFFLSRIKFPRKSD